MSLQGKKVAVVGMGVSGIASVKLANALGAEVYAVNSGKLEQWDHKLEEFDKLTAISQQDIRIDELLCECDFIVLSPGIARESTFLEQALLREIPVVSEIEFAYQSMIDDSSKIISVTGTNGKTTTVTLIAELASSAGKKIFLGGNIGTPFATYVLERILGKRECADVIILELSSFQLESMTTFKSDTAAILNISASHGERYDRVLDYAMAKFNITNRMDKDSKLFIGDLGEFEDSLKADCNIVSVSNPNGLEAIDSALTGNFNLIGEHNLGNLYFASLLLNEIGVEWRDGIQGLSNFHGVSYRLQKKPSIETLDVFNDAKSTNWEATITALRASRFSFPKSKIHLILGGQLRGHGDELGNKLDSSVEYVSKVYLFGESGKALLEEVSKKFDCELFDKLDDVVIRIKESTEEGVILFSPAFPSFDLYKNYIERGEHFDALVSEYLEH